MIRRASWAWFQHLREARQWGLCVVLCALFAPAPVSAQPSQQVGELRTLLGEAWTYLEAGNLAKAESCLNAAFDLSEGRQTAELYYATAAVWWERRNAMASYMWLSDAKKVARDSHRWNGGDGGEWDRRVDGRHRFIESHFSVIKLRAPRRGKPQPPLADPRPSDPVLREFTSSLPRVVAEGAEAKVVVQWVLLPRGTYWVGDELMSLGGKELDPAHAESWVLRTETRGSKKAYDRRVAALDASKSEALELLARRAAETEAGQTAVGRTDRPVAGRGRTKRKQGSADQTGAAVAARPKPAPRSSTEPTELTTRAVKPERKPRARPAPPKRSLRASVEKKRARSLGKSREGLSALTDRRVLVALGAGAVGLNRWTAAGSESSVDWSFVGEAAYVFGVGARGVGVTLGVSYANIPVSGCSYRQTRSGVVAVGAGARVPFSLPSGWWLSVRAGIHVGGSFTNLGSATRESCAEAALSDPSAPLAYGVPVGDSGQRISYGTLGWRGWGLVLGPDIEAAFLTRPRSAPMLVGAGLYLRHDQLLAVIDEGDHFFRAGSSTDSSVLGESYAALDGRVAMPRFQVGVRGMVMF